MRGRMGLIHAGARRALGIVRAVRAVAPSPRRSRWAEAGRHVSAQRAPVDVRLGVPSATQPSRPEVHRLPARLSWRAAPPVPRPPVRR